jgi:hypothetical protein
MRPKKVLMIWAQKFIYGWLIFCVGALAPLTSSTPLSPHWDVPSVYIAIFDSPPYFSFPSNLSEPIVSQLEQVWSAQRFNPNSNFRSFESFVPSLARFFQSSMSDGYLLTVARAYLLYQASLVGLIALYIFSGRSAVLPPLEKPPQLFFA